MTNRLISDSTFTALCGRFARAGIAGKAQGAIEFYLALFAPAIHQGTAYNQGALSPKNSARYIGSSWLLKTQFDGRN